MRCCRLWLSFIHSWSSTCRPAASHGAGFPWPFVSWLLSMAILATGFGSSLIVMMELAANPADGFARTLGKLVGREFGFGKNMMDLGCVAISASIGLLFGGKIVGIGVGTVFSAIFIGRCVAFTNWLIKSRVQRAVGI